MFKTYLPAIGFALTTTLALPALAQTNPSLEGYEGGHVAAQTAFDTAAVAPSFDANGNQLADNLSLEGYNGNARLNQAAVLSTQQVREQYASNAGITDDTAAAAKNIRDDFAAMEQRVRYSGR